MCFTFDSSVVKVVYTESDEVYLDLYTTMCTIVDISRISEYVADLSDHDGHS
jgi:hypothetical protein